MQKRCFESQYRNKQYYSILEIVAELLMWVVIKVIYTKDFGSALMIGELDSTMYR